ncbi:MAG: RidA family protein [Epsilonproteobacteria bacterium]|nr:RidA family protein [Campylobacterota bacterium]
MKIVSTSKAPQAIGPYSQAVIANGMVFTSGQIALNAEGELVSDDIKEQTRQVLTNLSHILEAAGSGLDKVIKTTIFLSDMDDFKVVNGIYEEFFKEHKPARSTIAVKTLPLNVKIEIDCIALV